MTENLTPTERLLAVLPEPLRAEAPRRQGAGAARAAGQPVWRARRLPALAGRLDGGAGPPACAAAGGAAGARRAARGAAGLVTRPVHAGLLRLCAELRRRLARGGGAHPASARTRGQLSAPAALPARPRRRERRRLRRGQLR